MLERSAESTPTRRQASTGCLPTPGRSAPSPPFVHVERLKTAGWRVVYVTALGKRVLVKKGSPYHAAIMSGAAQARIHECVLEVDR